MIFTTCRFSLFAKLGEFEYRLDRVQALVESGQIVELIFPEESEDADSRRCRFIEQSRRVALTRKVVQND